MFHDVASAGEMPDNTPLAVALPGGARVCLVRYNGQFAALRDECPHQGMPLSAGQVFPDGTIECPWHGARFDCLTGALRGGPAEDDATVYPVRVEHGRVLVADIESA